MDAKTAEIRYQRWVQAIQDWGNSGLSKRDYCQQNGIDEKQFYYYQRRIRAIIAAQAERPALPKGSFTVAASSVGQRSNRPQIVKLRFPETAEANAYRIQAFSISHWKCGEVPVQGRKEKPGRNHHGPSQGRVVYQPLPRAGSRSGRW